jgi:hypothetical protein
MDFNFINKILFPCKIHFLLDIFCVFVLSFNMYIRTLYLYLERARDVIPTLYISLLLRNGDIQYYNIQFTSTLGNVARRRVKRTFQSP